MEKSPTDMNSKTVRAMSMTIHIAPLFLYLQMEMQHSTVFTTIVKTTPFKICWKSTL